MRNRILSWTLVLLFLLALAPMASAEGEDGAFFRFNTTTSSREYLFTEDSSGQAVLAANALS